MKKYIIISLIFFCSCSPIKRLHRIIKKHPYLLNQVDTIYINDTVITKQIKIDTAFLSDFDTITITKENIEIQLIKHNDTIYLTEILKADTIVRRIPIEITKIINKPTRNKWLIALVVFCSFITIYLFYLFAKLFKSKN